jgi:hypothetical protein
VLIDVDAVDLPLQRPEHRNASISRTRNWQQSNGVKRVSKNYEAMKPTGRRLRLLTINGRRLRLLTINGRRLRLLTINGRRLRLLTIDY